ncbi:hypothetical protein T08_8731 [Trichinella sp. T8]|nr:hypothetical protein T08_8731 [Trichinella sp. T8]
MHRRNVSGRFSSDLRALLIADIIRRVSFRLREQILDEMRSDTQPR